MLYTQEENQIASKPELTHIFGSYKAEQCSQLERCLNSVQQTYTEQEELERVGLFPVA